MSRITAATFDFPGALKPSRSSHALIPPSSENSRDVSQQNGLSSIQRPFGDSDQCETHISEDAPSINPPFVSNSLLNRQASNSLLSKYSLLQQQDSIESSSSKHLQLSQLSDSLILQQLQKRSAFRNVKDSLVLFGTHKQQQSNINKAVDLLQKSEDPIEEITQLQYSDKQGNIIKSPKVNLKNRVDRSQECNTRDEITQFRATDCVGLSTGRSQSLLSAELSPWRQRISENMIQASINNANNGILNKQIEPQLQPDTSNEAHKQQQQIQSPQSSTLQNQLKIDKHTQLIEEKAQNPINQERISSPKGLIQFQNKQFLQGTAKSQDSHEYENDTLTPEDLLMNTQEFSRFQEVQLQLNHTQQANSSLAQNEQCTQQKVNLPLNSNNAYDINMNQQLNLKAYSMYSKNEIDITNNKSNVYLNSTVSFANLNKDIQDNTLCSPAASFTMLSPQFAHTHQQQQQLSQQVQLEYGQLPQDIHNQVDGSAQNKQKQLNVSSLPQHDLQQNHQDNSLPAYSSQQKQNLPTKIIPLASQNDRKTNKLMHHFSSAQLQQQQTYSSARNPHSSVQSSCNNQLSAINEKGGFNYFLSPFSNLNSIKESSRLFRQRSTSNISELKQGKEHVLSQKSSPQSNNIQPAKLQRSSSFMNQPKQHNNFSNYKNQGVIQHKNTQKINSNNHSKNEESDMLRERKPVFNNNNSFSSSAINQIDTLNKSRQVSSCQQNNQSQQSSLFVSIETSKAQLFAEEIFNLLPESNRECIDFQTLLLVMIDAGLVSLASFSKNKNSSQISNSNQQYFDETQATTASEIEQKLFFAIWTLLGGRNAQFISVNDLIQLLIIILNIPQPSEIKSQYNSSNSTKQRSISPSLTKSRSISSLSQQSNPSPFSRKRTSKVVETFSALLKTTSSKQTTPQQIKQQKQQHQIEIEPILKEYDYFIQNAPESFLLSFTPDNRLWTGSEDEKALLRQAFELLSRNRAAFEQSCYNSISEKQVNSSLNSTTVIPKKQSSSSIFHQGSSYSIEGKENINCYQSLVKLNQSNKDSNKRNKNETNCYESYENRFEKKYTGGIYGKNVNKLIDRMRNTRIEREILQEPLQLTKRNAQLNPSITAETDRFINSLDATAAISASNVQLKQQHKDISQQLALNEMYSRKQSTVVIGNSAESLSCINSFQRM